MDDLSKIAEEARKQLGQQKNKKEDKNIAPNEDIYKDFRAEAEDDYNYNINSTPTEPLQEYPKINNQINENYYNEYPEYDIDSSYSSPIFEGGPTKEMVDIWKKQWEGYEIFLVELPEQLFVCRSLSRYEYKQIVSLRKVDALQREEIICETVVLWPVNFGIETMSVGNAGTPSTLAEIIMNKSGFSKEYNIQVL